ncbi:hypothetical protein SMICM304S_08918 [Streptomyces microflavus]
MPTSRSRSCCGWDFPDGTLAQRQVAAYEISRATGWDLVPPTVLRDGPYGEGMCQLWIDGPDPTEGEQALLALVEDDEPGEGWKAVGFADVGQGKTALLVHADDPRLRRLAVLDAVINNGDRKGGHLLRAPAPVRHRPRGHLQRGRQAAQPPAGWAGEPLTEEALRVLGLLAGSWRRGSPWPPGWRNSSRRPSWKPCGSGWRGCSPTGCTEAGRPVAADSLAARVAAGPGSPAGATLVQPFGGLSQECLFGRIPDPVRIRKRRPVTLMTCMPGPLLRSPPCLARAATFGSTTPRPADGSPLTPVPSPASTSAASRRTTRPTWVMRRPTTRSTSFNACGSTPSGRFTTSRT